MDGNREERVERIDRDGNEKDCQGGKVLAKKKAIPEMERNIRRRKSKPEDRPGLGRPSIGKEVGKGNA